MKRNKGIIFLFCVVIVTVMACNLPSAQPAVAPPPSEGVDVDATMTSAVLTQAALQNQPSEGGQLPAQPEFTATLTMTPTITPTGTPSIPMVSVSLDTNCRTGPGVVYDYLAALLVGEKAEVVGKYTTVVPNYWVIKKGSYTCWLWGKYATVEGNISSLPEMVPPPSPTPSPTDTPTPTATATIFVGQPDIYISDITYNPASPHQGDLITIKVTTYNKGNTAAGPYMVEWYSSPAMKQCEWAVPGNNANGGKVLTCTYTYNSWSTYTTRAVADTGNTVAESDETNNTLQQALQVQP